MQSIGIGATTIATVDDILQLLAHEIGPIQPGTILASVSNRADLARAVGHTIGLEVQIFPATVLATIRGVSASCAQAARALGSASVAEAAALAALGPTAVLRLPKRIGRQCTCALAEVRR